MTIDPLFYQRWPIYLYLSFYFHKLQIILEFYIPNWLPDPIAGKSNIIEIKAQNKANPSVLLEKY